MSKEFDAFKKTLSKESLQAIYDETKLEVSQSELEGTDAFSIELASQMAVNLLETYHNWLNEN
ncbi:hypothetical protein [Streptococcus loxodontisalivarius]|uniref:Cytoplasmic protein n=1 Tax=Streptococcus loxodontisalivarius TaxID=1349415 RepID=A0ABS2PQ90_9STRE|nr:hypothetical protein [Streptococcus loxodontisalivarius]MBM7642208.1 hypothetical protein [Streptococcus loxodontisalivarius]